MTDLREREAAKKLFAVEKRKGEALQIDDNFLINCVVITSGGQNVYHDHKVPTGVNFINVKHANFSYKRRFGSFFLVTCTLKNDVRA
jgi:hypothetical protein